MMTSTARKTDEVRILINRTRLTSWPLVRRNLKPPQASTLLSIQKNRNGQSLGFYHCTPLGLRQLELFHGLLAHLSCLRVAYLLSVPPALFRPLRCLRTFPLE
jgi:hypothetical protein